jgi:hypothetical protein
MPKFADNDAPSGEILAHGNDFRQVRVRLANGEEIVAVLPKLRKFGCLFGPLVGWKVRVAFRQAPKMPRVIDLERPAVANQD